MPKLVETVIAVAREQVGVHEGRSAGHWNNHQKYSAEVPGLAWSDYQPWCATFVSWVAFKSGTAALYPSSASCDAGGAWFKKLGRWSEYPAIGAQVYFGSSRDLNHTGLVYDYDDTYVYTIEGNTNNSGSREGDGVYLKKRLRRDANLVGYGYPKFPEGINSADPAWATPTTKPKPPAVVPTPPKHSAGSARVDLVDLSHHNVGVTLTALRKAKAAGVKGVYHKATEGHRFVDSQYAVRRRLAAQVGLPFGGYHFARPSVSSGTLQAQDFLKVAALKPGDLAPVLDLEDRGGLSDVELTRWVRRFCAEVERQLGVKGFIYTPFDLTDTCGWRLWVARYSDTMKAPRIPKPWATWSIWQFSNGEFGKPNSVPGLGHCDINTLSWTPKPALTRLRIAKSRPVVVAPSPAAPVTIKPKPVTFRNMTANVQHTDPAVQTIAEIGRLAQLADVIGWQEIETPVEVNALKALEGFEHFLPGGAANAVPISWRTAVFELVTSESILVHRGIPHVTPNRYINVVVLQHKASGLMLTRINTHVLNGIERGGLPIANLIRRPKAKKHFTMLAAQLMRWNDIIVAGDFNVNYFAEKHLPVEQRCSWFPLTALRNATFVMPAVGTHGPRAIDWTAHTGALQADIPFLAPVGFSDHRAVITEYTFTKESHVV